MKSPDNEIIALEVYLSNGPPAFLEAFKRIMEYMDWLEYHVNFDTIEDLP